MGLVTNWGKYPNFSEHEFKCSETGLTRMDTRFMDVLQLIRTSIGRPMVITSGYRDPSHSIEAAKSKPGEHTFGLAADIAGDRLFLLDLIVVAYGLGIRRIGVNFSKGYIHLGLGDEFADFPSVPWDYSKGD